MALGLIAVATLFFQLLFLLLSAGGGAAWSTQALRLGTPATAGLPPTGVIRALSARLDCAAGPALTLEVSLQSTDIAASSTATEARTILLPPLPAPPGGPRLDHAVLDRAGLAARLGELRRLDPAWRRVELSVAPSCTAGALLEGMEAIQAAGLQPVWAS